MLRKQPGYAAVAVITLALGIGANTAMFSVVNFFLIRSLPFPEPERLFAIFEKRPKEQHMNGIVAAADFFDWREQSRSFEMAAWQRDVFNLLDGEPERITGARVSPNFFEVLGVKPRIGATFAPEHEIVRNQLVVVLTDPLWRRRYGADSQIVGKGINLNGFLHTVIGVLPPEFELPQGDAQFYKPFAPTANDRADRGSHFLNVVARLKPGVSMQPAIAEMDGISARLEREHKDFNTGHYANVIPLQDSLAGPIRQSLLVLLGAVGLVLLIACANLANLQLARAASRRNEIAVRLAIGASPWRITRQLLTESVLLSLIAGCAGLVLALWTTDALHALTPALNPQNAFGNPLSLLDRVRIDGRVLGFAAAASFLSGILFGLAPALQARGNRFTFNLKEGLRASSGHDVLRKLLVVSQVALSLALLIGAGLLLRSFDAARSQDPGFRSGRVLTWHLNLSTYPDSRKATFLEELLRRLRALPEVQQAGLTSHLPASGSDSRTGFAVDGVPTQPGVPRRAHFRVVSPGYFETLNTTLRQGRYFSANDTRDSRPVIIVNEAAARYWPDANPVGRRARFAVTKEWHEVVGVVANARHWGLDVEPRPEAYLCDLQVPYWSNFIVVRTSGDPRALAGAARAQVRELDRALPLGDLRTMDEVVSRSLANRRFYMLLLAGFAALALLLAVSGVYGVVNYLVTQRTPEIGIRVALGATRSDVVRHIVLPSSGLVLTGSAVGIAAALVFSKLLETFVYGIQPRDPWTFAVVPLVLLIAALSATAIPALRAVRIDPVIALRNE